VPERPLISLTMIVKNEEKNIARVLDEARGLADELIVVDTGSTDRTVEIAEACGASVRFFEWIDDFSAARNFAIEHATGEWILVLDGDDGVVESAPGALRAEVAAQPASVLFMRVPVRSPRADGTGYSVIGSRRLFRNCPEIRWRHPVHETLVHQTLDQDPSTEFGAASLVIEHLGYADVAHRQKERKLDRNLRILKDAIARQPDHPNWYLYLAREHSHAGHNVTALRLIRRGLRRFAGRIRPDFEGAFRVLGMRIAMKMGKPDLAVKLGLPAVSLYAYSELCFTLALAYTRLHDLDQAERFLRLAIRLRGRVAQYQSDAGTGSWKAMIQLGAIAWERGDRALALERWRGAYEWAPEQGVTNMALGRGLMAVGSPVEAEPLLRRAVELSPIQVDAQLGLASALFATGQQQEAYDRLDALTRERPEVAGYWLALADLLRTIGEHEACVEVLGRAMAQHGREDGLYRRLALSLRELGRLEEALEALTLVAAA
jgi:glycosyltransferase involved in cell wall biosynthesis